MQWQKGPGKGQKGEGGRQKERSTLRPTAGRGRERQRQSGKTSVRKMKLGNPFTPVCCKLQLDRAQTGGARGWSRPTTRPPTPTSPALFRGHTRRVSPRNLLRRTGLRGQAAITPRCPALPCGIQPHTSDCRDLLLTIGTLHRRRICPDKCVWTDMTGSRSVLPFTARPASRLLIKLFQMTSG